MASSFTTNKDIEKPGNGDYVDTWNVPLNGDMTVVDYALGTSQSFNATAGSQTLGTYDHATKALSTYSYIPMFLNITGAISANVTYTIPSGVGGQWIVYNSTTDATTGPWYIIFASAGGGRSVAVPRLSRITIVSDGTNVDFMGYAVLNYTSSGSLAVTGSLTAGTTITAGTAISAGTTSSDSIGNLRNVPPNAQTSSYILTATDSGKYISITTGGVTVPFVTTTGLLSAGQTISIYNNSSVSQTITQASGVTIAFAGTISTGNRTLAANGLCTLLCTGVNTYVITGAGVL
jgi:hypothetical protein